MSWVFSKISPLVGWNSNVSLTPFRLSNSMQSPSWWFYFAWLRGGFPYPYTSYCSAMVPKGTPVQMCEVVLFCGTLLATSASPNCGLILQPRLTVLGLLLHGKRAGEWQKAGVTLQFIEFFFLLSRTKVLHCLFSVLKGLFLISCRAFCLFRSRGLVWYSFLRVWQTAALLQIQPSTT